MSINFETKSGLNGLLRKTEHLGTWCGYVEVPERHPLHGADLYEGNCVDDLMNLEVHGGVTFAGEINGAYYIGFDCAHAGDYVPAYGFFGYGSKTYRDEDYVRKETERLAYQIKEFEYEQC